MTPMEQWYQRWKLNEDYLGCVHCHAYQWPHHSDRPFEHQAGCTVAGTEQYPWLDLARIVRNKQAPLI